MFHCLPRFELERARNTLAKSQSEDILLVVGTCTAVWRDLCWQHWVRYKQFKAFLSISSLYLLLLVLALDEVGGVPADILMPVLERCTPSQLFHLEDYNPVSLMMIHNNIK